MNKPIRLLALLLAVLLAGAGSFYYFYWSRTPAYAAGEIREAIVEKNFQLFQERVDLRQVYGYAIDDLIDEASSSDQKEHKIAANLMRALKKPLTEEMIHQTGQYFQKKNPQPDHSPLAAVTRTIKAYTGSAALSFTDIADIREEGNAAKAMVRLHDSSLNRDFTWELTMEKDVNGRWAVTRIDNLKEYLKERKQAILEQ